MAYRGIKEADLENEAMAWLVELGYTIGDGESYTPENVVHPVRSEWSESILRPILARSIARLNPSIPEEAREDALAKLLRDAHPTLIENNRRFHGFLRDGIPVEYRHVDGSIRHDTVRLIDFERVANNEFLAVNQFTVIEKSERRPDIIIFINGLPLVVMELKHPTSPGAEVQKAYNDLQLYKEHLPRLMTPNVALVASDGFEARLGTITAGWDRFAPWRSIAGEDPGPRRQVELHTLIHGAMEPHRLLRLIRSYVMYEENLGGEISKKIAAYHQFFASEKAVDCTVQATRPEGDRRIGVVWHTQGSGKSLSMVFYTGRIVRHPAMENPTIVVLTDRNDLDDQLFAQFGRASSLLGQVPVQAESREDLKEKLRVASGGIVFTTIQKFGGNDNGRYPMLSDRRNIVVIADEAHRSQYDFIDGFAANMRDALPNAAFIGFTGTPIELSDKSTRAVFGDYIDTYDMPQAVDDGATVRIYYEGRLAKLGLDEDEKPHIDEEFEEITEGQEEDPEKTKTKWAQLEKVVGSDKRLTLVAQDIVEHFEARQEAMEGKAMIVAMSRRIAVDLYKQIVAIKPEWHDPDPDKGVIKVVMTGTKSDPVAFHPHLLGKEERKLVEKRFKDPDDTLKLVIVRDMWLTGFDVPPLHTMYVDKPMQGHGLMQAIARVNRVFRDKDGGLIVDYLGIAHNLKEALSVYTGRGQQEVGIDQAEAVALLQEKVEIVTAMFHGFDWKTRRNGTVTERLQLMLDAEEQVLSLPDGKSRFLKQVDDLSKAFALATPHEYALSIREDVGFFQEVRNRLKKTTIPVGERETKTETALRQLISRSVVADDVVDIFSAAGMDKPEISILSEEFLREVEDMPQRNLALEALRKLLNDEVKQRSARNVVEGRSFADMLEKTILRYQNRSIETAEAISELIRIAREMRESADRGEKLGLSERELAFYDAIASVESVKDVLDDETLRAIAREVLQTVRNSATIDWTKRESTRAGMKLAVRKALRKHKFPKESVAIITELIFSQAATWGDRWAA